MLSLDSKLGTVPAAFDSSKKEVEGWTGLYMDDPQARVRLSHSTFELLHGCERKFQKTKLLVNERARDESPATIFGKSIGAAWQYYFLLRSVGRSVKDSLDSSLYIAWLEYFPVLEDDKRFQERAAMVMIRSGHFSYA